MSEKTKKHINCLWNNITQANMQINELSEKGQGGARKLVDKIMVNYLPSVMKP